MTAGESSVGGVFLGLTPEIHHDVPNARMLECIGVAVDPQYSLSPAWGYIDCPCKVICTDISSIKDREYSSFWINVL